MFFLLLLFGIVTSIIPVLSVQSVAVITDKGTVLGQRQDYQNVFLGVPYAKVNETRPFENTTDYIFTTPFNASNPNITCPQILRTVSGTIQCLRLNIYVPTTRTKDLPVFLWFHGGGFVMGSAGQYDPKPLIKHGIIVITVNYRLGPYGFLCTDIINNQGLKDQIKAMKWVKNNIKAFGGDPTNVTIGGQSYGGGAVDFHLYSNEILFNKAIIESGSKFVDDIKTERDDKPAISIARFLGSNVTNIKDAINYLNKANPFKVMAATRDLKLRFRVCSDYLESDDYKFAKRIKNTPILIGYQYCKEDFSSFATQNDTFYENLGDIFQANLDKITNNRKIPDIVRKFYLGGKNISKNTMLELVDFTSDFRLNAAVETSIDNYLKYDAKVFKYIFSYTGGSPYNNITGVGAYHTEELQYIFDMGPRMNTEEKQLVRDRMTTLWTNFIKFGDPTPKQTKILPVKWKATDIATKTYLNIDVKLQLLQQVYHQRMAFWELLR